MQTEPMSRERLSIRRRVAVAVAAGESVEAHVNPATAPALAHINSLSLLRGGKCVQIEHNGALYKLQATKLGKLILTK